MSTIAESATALTKNEVRRFLADGTMPENYRERCNHALEFDTCSNCDERKCMGCVMREWEHDCQDDCPFCCEPGYEDGRPVGRDNRSLPGGEATQADKPPAPGHLSPEPDRG